MEAGQHDGNDVVIVLLVMKVGPEAKNGGSGGSELMLMQADRQWWHNEWSSGEGVGEGRR